LGTWAWQVNHGANKFSKC